MKNSDRIRTMSDVELADRLATLGAGPIIEDLICKRCGHTRICDETGLCVYKTNEVIKIWLSQEECYG